MSISSISSGTMASLQTTLDANAKQQAQDLKTLQAALKSGDLSSAQTAFAALQQDMQSSSQSTQGTQSSSSSSISDSFKALQTALQKGDVPGAQSAFASLQTAMKAGHHHRHQSASDAGSAMLNDAVTSTDTTASDSSSGGILNTLA